MANVEAARAALNTYIEEHGDTDEIIDLVVDLMHLYAESGSDAMQMVDMAKVHFDEEC